MGVRMLCLALAALLLVPGALADHKGLRIRLGDDRGRDEDDRKEDREEEREAERDQAEREQAEREQEQREREAAIRREAEQDAEGQLPEGCVAASGGATESGNVVAWPATDAGLLVQRRAGDGEWTTVHEAEPGDAMWLDKDVRKGRAYTYRVGHEDAVAACPTVEMTAVPFATALGAAAMVTVTAGAAWAVARRR